MYEKTQQAEKQKQQQQVMERSSISVLQAYLKSLPKISQRSNVDSQTWSWIEAKKNKTVTVTIHALILFHT